MRARTLTRSRTLSHTHTHTHARTRTRTHTYTHHYSQHYNVARHKNIKTIWKAYDASSSNSFFAVEDNWMQCHKSFEFCHKNLLQCFF